MAWAGSSHDTKYSPFPHATPESGLVLEHIRFLGSFVQSRAAYGRKKERMKSLQLLLSLLVWMQLALAQGLVPNDSALVLAVEQLPDCAVCPIVDDLGNVY